MRESIVYPAIFRESRLRHLLGAYSTLSSSSHNCFKFLRTKFVIVVYLTQVYFIISVNSGTNSKPTRRQSEMTSPRKSMWYPKEEKEEQQTRKVVHDFLLVFFSL